MSAKEMFEVLGYEYEYFRTPVDAEFDIEEGSIWYTRKGKSLTISICFYLSSKRWMINGNYGNGVTGGIHASVELFLAIQQQMKELGWIE